MRIISATHQNLARNVQQGLFRQDLYYRLNVIALELPPLRMRRDDIAPLAQAILRRLAPSTPAVVLSDEALVALGAHDFPGNVRELENIIERALAFADDGVISVARRGLLATRRRTSVPHPCLRAACRPMPPWLRFRWRCLLICSRLSAI